MTVVYSAEFQTSAGISENPLKKRQECTQLQGRACSRHGTSAGDGPGPEGC